MCHTRGLARYCRPTVCEVNAVKRLNLGYNFRRASSNESSLIYNIMTSSEITSRTRTRQRWIRVTARTCDPTQLRHAPETSRGPERVRPMSSAILTPTRMVRCRQTPRRRQSWDERCDDESACELRSAAIWNRTIAVQNVCGKDYSGISCSCDLDPSIWWKV